VVMNLRDVTGSATGGTPFGDWLAVRGEVTVTNPVRVIQEGVWSYAVTGTLVNVGLDANTMMNLGIEFERVNELLRGLGVSVVSNGNALVDMGSNTNNIDFGDLETNGFENVFDGHSDTNFFEWDNTPITDASARSRIRTLVGSLGVGTFPDQFVPDNSQLPPYMVNPGNTTMSCTTPVSVVQMQIGTNSTPLSMTIGSNWGSGGTPWYADRAKGFADNLVTQVMAYSVAACNWFFFPFDGVSRNDTMVVSPMVEFQGAPCLNSVDINKRSHYISVDMASVVGTGEASRWWSKFIAICVIAINGYFAVLYMQAGGTGR